MRWVELGAQNWCTTTLGMIPFLPLPFLGLDRLLAAAAWGQSSWAFLCISLLIHTMVVAVQNSAGTAE
jgi:hypothetical protein